MKLRRWPQPFANTNPAGGVGVAAQMAVAMADV